MTALARPLCPLDLLPVELFASILSELDLASLLAASSVSTLFRSVVASPLLNPWRQPIRRVLLSSDPYPAEFALLGARQIVPRRNWIEILALARLEWILLSATMPSLTEKMWEEAFNRRWLPGMRRWKKEGSWQEAFKRTAMRLWHRLNTSCTADESWCRYVLLNRNGSANLCEAYARTFNPLAVFDEFKLQANLMHLETQVRLIVQFLDIRVIALGVLHHASSLFVNSNARQLLHPPGVQSWIDDSETISDGTEASDTLASMPLSIASQRSLQVAFTPQSLRNPYTPLLMQNVGIPLSRARSSGSTDDEPPNGRYRRRTMSNEPGTGILRRLTVSLGAGIFGVGQADAGPASPQSAGPVLGRSASHQPEHTRSQPPPPRHTNGHTHSFSASTSSPLQAESAGPSSSRTHTTTDDPISSSLAPPVGELTYPPLRYPTPISAHRNYPNYTPGGGDNRWRSKGTLLELDEGGKLWAGPMMIVAQLVHPDHAEVGEDLDLVGQTKWAAFTVQDLFAIAPWMEERITKVVDGMGLGVF